MTQSLARVRRASVGPVKSPGDTTQEFALDGLKWDARPEQAADLRIDQRVGSEVARAQIAPSRLPQREPVLTGCLPQATL